MISTNSSSAPSASSKITHMAVFSIGQFRNGTAAAILGLLVACSTTPPPTPAPPPGVSAPPSEDVFKPYPPDYSRREPDLLRERSRWVAVGWGDLPGWELDRAGELWPALLRGCERPAAGWASVCAQARSLGTPDDTQARAWLMARLQPYRIESMEGQREGLITGYYEPLVTASRRPQAGFRTALHRPPADLATRRPYWTRQQLERETQARQALLGREIAFIEDPLDALVLQIQGSGRLHLTEPDGSQRLVRLAFAGHNDQPYKSVGRWLIEQGELRPEGANWPAIKDWARRNPGRINELLWSNPRVVFFREEPLPDPNAGPRGGQAVPLTPGRSIAVDTASVPYGTPVWLDSTEPLSNTPLRRLVMAQDTGSAITGAVRADFFWGWGSTAEQQAGRMKQPLRMWALWPREGRS
ncbi:MAG: MltA domain-containing protein [Burkholderiaceae bacterium]|nr:MltA domain-containing protein [Burkholderiaceae bacterium]